MCKGFFLAPWTLCFAVMLSLPTACAVDCYTSFDQSCLPQAYSGEQVEVDQKQRQKSLEVLTNQGVEGSEVLLNACLHVARQKHEAEWMDACGVEANSNNSRLQACLLAAKFVKEMDVCQNRWGAIDETANCSLSPQQKFMIDLRHEEARDDCFKLYLGNHMSW